MANEERERLEWLRKQPCCLKGNGRCFGTVQAHHAPGHKGMGTRNHDDTGKPLCVQHHTERHSVSGHFRGWDKARLRDWEELQAEAYRRAYAAHLQRLALASGSPPKAPSEPGSTP